MIRISVFLLLFLSGMLMCAQEKLTVSGVEYIVHEVERKQTLYAISKAYSVSLEDLLNANPSTKSGLNTGQRILIPTTAVNKKDKKTAPVIENGELKHTVSRKETWYSISKRYNVELTDLLEHNPEFNDGLGIGDIVRIPEKKVKSIEKWAVDAPDTVNGRFHIVKQGETLYSISKLYEIEIAELKSLNHLDDNILAQGMQLRLPPKEIVVAEIPLAEPLRPLLKSSYNIAFYLPFSLDRNDSIYVNSDEERIYPLTDIAVQFYFGARMALDTLESLGLQANVAFEDAPAGIKSFSGFDAEHSDYDLVIGPFHKESVEKLAESTKAKNIPHICPVTRSNRVVMERPNLFKAKSGRVEQIEAITSYAAKHHTKGNVVIFLPDNEEEKELRLMALNRLKAKMPDIQVHEVYNLSDPMKFRTHFQLTELNSVIIPSENHSIVSGLLTKLNGLADQHPMVVYGLEKWADFENIDLAYKEKLNVHLAMSEWVDRSREDVARFVETFRADHGNDPSEYAFLGYDVTLHFGQELLLKGIGFPQLMDQGPKARTMHMEFDMRSTGIGNGMRNMGVIMVSHANGKLTKLQMAEESGLNTDLSKKAY